MLVGSGLYILSVLVLIALGYGRIDGTNPVSVLIPAIAASINAGFLEELLFRSALYRIVEERRRTLSRFTRKPTRERLAERWMRAAETYDAWEDRLAAYL